MLVVAGKFCSDETVGALVLAQAASDAQLRRRHSYLEQSRATARAPTASK